MTIRVPDPKANTTTEAYLAYKAGYLEESELKPKLYKPDWHFDGWLAYWTGLTDTYPIKENGDPEMLTDEEALVAYLSGVTDTYPEEIKDPYDVRIVGYLKHLASKRWPEPDYPVNNEEFYLSTMEPTHTSNPVPSSDIELDTADGKIISVEAYGDTAQQTYSGKNLAYTGWAENFVTRVNNSIRARIETVDSKTCIRWIDATGYGDYDNQYIFKIDFKADTQYTISFDVKPTAKHSLIAFAYTDGTTGTSPSNLTAGEWQHITMTSVAGKTVKYIQPVYKSGAVDVDLNTFMVEEGNTESPYEPYTGSTPTQLVPSPNPDYPQTVNVVTGTQNVWVESGENLFDISTFEMGGMVSGQITTSNARITNINNPLKVEPNTEYEISVNLGGDIKGFRIGIHQLDANKNFLSDSNWQQLVPNPYKFTTGANTAYIGIVCSCSVTSETVISGSNESGYQASTPTQWLRGCMLDINEGVAYTVDLGATELCKIGTYQDKIYKSGDDWYVHKACGSILLNGSENWSTRTNLDNILQMTVVTAATNIMSGSVQKLNNYGKWYASTYNYGKIGDFELLSNTTAILIGVNPTETVDSFKTKLLSNNMSVYYPLATPTDTKITDATLVGQLDALAGADTYNRKTFIIVTANDPNLPALLKVEAYKY